MMTIRFFAVHSAHAVWQSPEMKTLLTSSRDVMVSAVCTTTDLAVCTSGWMIQTMCLPVTLPLHVASTTTQMAVGLAAHAWQQLAFLGDSSSSSSSGECTSSQPPLQQTALLQWASLVEDEDDKDNKGDAPSSSSSSSSNNAYEYEAGEPSAKQPPYSTTFLDRLRLDIDLPSSQTTTTTTTTTPQSTTIIPRVSNATPSDSSKFLLRVDDVCVMVSQDPAVEPEEETTNSCCGSQDNNPSLLFQALYIDLGREFSEQSITLDALQQLRNKALEVTATNSDAHIMCIPSSSSSFLQNTTTTTTTTNTTTTTTTNANIRIHWKPEGSTHKHMKQLAKLDDSSSTEECYQKLKHHVLIWSGSYHNKGNHQSFYGSQYPLFLARGVVQKSPREFLNLLWDSSRTHEYNQYSLGRTDVLVIQDNIIQNNDNNNGHDGHGHGHESSLYGAKVVKSETKVPFSGLSVTLSALMHASPLDKNDESQGFVIVSRSLNSGMAGCHIAVGQVETQPKNEILLGVNIMRPVPGHPDLTDLISVSQVSSTMVPQFLAFRIGMMGIQDFFHNVRA